MANLDIDHTYFTPARIRAGYDMGEVDAFLDRAKIHLGALDAAATGTGPMPAELNAASFSVVRLREGYDIGEVDAFLEQLDAEEARLRALVGDGTAFASTTPPASPTTVAQPAPAPHAIREVGSQSANMVLAVLVLAALIAIALVVLLSK
jgi:DivIVA domain-containing protein